MPYLFPNLNILHNNFLGLKSTFLKTILLAVLQRILIINSSTHVNDLQCEDIFVPLAINLKHFLNAIPAPQLKYFAQ